MIVPGHGPLADQDAVRELRAYFEYLYVQARAPARRGHRPGAGGALAGARRQWAQWGESERLAVNIATIYRELDGDPEPANALVAFQQMAELASHAAVRPASGRPASLIAPTRCGNIASASCRGPATRSTWTAIRWAACPARPPPN